MRMMDNNSTNIIIVCYARFCRGTKGLTSILTSLVRKSAPMVALYWLENFLLTYWFISDVFPTPELPRMMTLRRTFFRDAISGLCLVAL